MKAERSPVRMNLHLLPIWCCCRCCCCDLLFVLSFVIVIALFFSIHNQHIYDEWCTSSNELCCYEFRAKCLASEPNNWLILFILRCLHAWYYQLSYCAAYYQLSYLLSSCGSEQITRMSSKFDVLSLDIRYGRHLLHVQLTVEPMRLEFNEMEPDIHWIRRRGLKIYSTHSEWLIHPCSKDRSQAHILSDSFLEFGKKRKSTSNCPLRLTAFQADYCSIIQLFIHTSKRTWKCLSSGWMAQHTKRPSKRLDGIDDAKRLVVTLHILEIDFIGWLALCPSAVCASA